MRHLGLPVIAEPFVLALIALAAYRLAHVLVGTDSLLAEPHRRLVGAVYELDSCGDLIVDACEDPIRRLGVGPVRAKAVDLILCPHCIGYWLGAGMLCTWTARWPWQLGWRGWITTAAIAGAQSLLTALDGR